MIRRLVPAVLAGVLLAGLAPADAAVAPAAGPAPTQQAARGTAERIARPPYVPRIRHVFVINIENKGYDKTWGKSSPAPYLAKTLRKKGVLLNSYYGTAHNSLNNYIGQISGQGPDSQQQADCQFFSDFVQTGTAEPQQALGTGCVFPDTVRTLPRQMTRHDLRWRGYMQDMERRCQHPELNEQDPTQHATAKHMYAVRHNPFVYFHSIIDHPKYCKARVVNLRRLTRDLKHASTTPNLAYITPDLCADGHDAPCADGRAGGLKAVNAFMKRWVPKILKSRAFKRNGMLVITADESDGPQTDSSACCDEEAANTIPPNNAGVFGPGGGRIGALVISKFAKPNSWSTTPYNHYSLLGSMEEIFGLEKIGYARTVTDVFGLDVYNSGWDQ